MKFTLPNIGAIRIGILVCLVASSGVWAQGPDKPSSGAPAQVASASGSPTADKAMTTTTLEIKAHDNSFVIGADDVLAINVWKEPEVSRAVPVRSDGRISLPLVGELQASGQTPRQLEEEIASKLKGYISEPEVTVIVQEIKSQKFNVLGMVVRPGSYPLTNSLTVLDAIALAGGFRDFAKQKSIYVLRQTSDGSESRLPFNYKEVIKGRNTAQNIRIQAHDTIVIP